MPYWPHDAGLTEKPYAPGARAAYLDECRHWPACVDCWLCGLRRRLDEAVREGTVTQGEATRLVKRYLTEGRG